MTKVNAVKSNSSFLSLSEQQVMIRDLARQVATEVIAPTAAERDRAAAWPRAELKALGLSATPSPTDTQPGHCHIPEMNAGNKRTSQVVVAMTQLARLVAGRVVFETSPDQQTS